MIILLCALSIFDCRNIISDNAVIMPHAGLMLRGLEGTHTFGASVFRSWTLIERFDKAATMVELSEERASCKTYLHAIINKP